jgi:S1-C subfamily serine protease
MFKKIILSVMLSILLAGQTVCADPVVGTVVSGTVVGEAAYPALDALRGSVAEVHVMSARPIDDVTTAIDSTLGTAFFVTKTLLVTNRHVVDIHGRTAINLYYNTGDKDHRKVAISANVVAVDTARDLALLEIDAKDGEYVTPFAFGVDAPGTPVAAMGFPLESMGSTYPRRNEGIIENPATGLVSIMQRPGNSGSPILNYSGQVVGVTYAVMKEANGTYLNIACYVSGQYVQQFVNSYIDNHREVAAQ